MSTGLCPQCRRVVTGQHDCRPDIESIARALHDGGDPETCDHPKRRLPGGEHECISMSHWRSAATRLARSGVLTGCSICGGKP